MLSILMSWLTRVHINSFIRHKSSSRIATVVEATIIFLIFSRPNINCHLEIILELA